MSKYLPSGRGFYIWRLPKCENGDIGKIIDRCQECNISWLAIKCGDQGGEWSQFTPELVKQLKDAGISVGGWSYDTPGDDSHLQKQADVYLRAVQDGAQFVLLDTEVEFECKNADDYAKRYCDKVKDSLLMYPDVSIGYAPIDVISFHQAFPYTVFSEACDWTSPQAYWATHGISEVSSTKRYLEQWTSFEAHNSMVKKPRAAGGTCYGSSTAAEMLHFERTLQLAGEIGCLYWSWQQAGPEIWSGLSGKAFGEV